MEASADTPAAAPFEKAVFTNAHKRDYTARWVTFLVLLLLLAGVYAVARHIVYGRLVRRAAQKLLDDLATARVETVGDISIDRQGDVTLMNAEAYTEHRGHRRLFFRTRKLRLTLDGMPLRDESIRVMRVDLFQPEIFVRREYGGEWNLQWALITASKRNRTPPPVADRWKDYVQPDFSFPRNGVYVHDGTVHVTFVSKSGREVTWRISGVHAACRNVNGRLVIDPARGDFYGGRIVCDAEITGTSPLRISQLKADVRGADVARMAAGRHFITQPVSGRFDAVVALRMDPALTAKRPIAAGHAEITQGNLWEFPVFAGILNLLTLTPISERRIDSSVLEFTVEEDQIRVDKMYFLGHPVSLFGDGACSLTGDWIEIVFIPKLGKSDWNSILPIIGAPIELLSSLLKGAFLPVVLSGTFEEPTFSLEPLYAIRPSIRKLVEEKAPR